MNDIFANTETMRENEHPRFYTAESVMRGHPDKLCDLIADSVLDECLKHDPASRVACEVMATHGHIIVAGEITTSAKPDVFNIVRDTLRDMMNDKHCNFITVRQRFEPCHNVIVACVTVICPASFTDTL